MANPNRVMFYQPKRPFSIHEAASNSTAADAKVEALKAEGWDAKWTRSKVGPRPTKPGQKQAYTYTVWKRERV